MTTQSRQQRPAFSLRVLLALAFIVLCSVALIFQAMTPVARAATTKANASSVSPLIFGTNLGLYNSSDQVLNSAPTRAALESIPVTIIRMPIRGNQAGSLEKTAAQTIKSMNATPLIIMHGATDSTALADDTQIVNTMKGIFGSGTVYYEFGNEEDLAGVTASQYVSAWNSVIPSLKPLESTAKFIGPVNYQYNHSYLQTFLQQANPRPDDVSWHMYTCSPTDSNSTCLNNLNNWSTYISDAKSLMQSTLGTVLPIMITEWNFDPQANDSRADNSPTNAFVTQWTTNALQQLISNGVFASMQYAATDSGTEHLVNTNNVLTAQGLAMQAVYKQTFSGGGTPTPTPTLSPTAASTPTPSPTVTPPPTSGFGFEDGTTDGWGTSGNITAVGSTDYAYVGTHSLEVKFPSIDSDDYPYTSVAGSHLSPAPQAGQTLTAYVYIPSSESLSVSGWLFVQDSNYKWYKESPVTITKGAWQKLTFPVPANANQIGIQFNGTGSGSVYVDEVRWS